MPTVVMVIMVWLFWAWLSGWVLRGDLRRPRRVPGSAAHEGTYIALAYRFSQVMCRIVHRLRVEGREHVPHEPGALVIVANHTAGVDPTLIQVALDFEVRWMMAKDMRIGGLEHVWNLLRIIEVDREATATGKRDTRSLRTAISHLKAGGCIGIFPQGKIVLAGEPRAPFQPGAAMIALMAEAPILPVHITGTPSTQSVWASLCIPSRSRVRFGPLITPMAGEKADALTARLEAWFAGHESRV
jgi:1-acyl-sn-glycerol-3-phosphate acyltransferase